MPDAWFDTPWSELGTVVLSTLAMLAIAIVVIRIIGLRALSKMSSFDFVVTIALGSMVAAVGATSTPLEQGAAAFATLLGAQWTISKLRRKVGLGSVVDNQPVLLMDGPRFVEANLKQTRVTETDVIAKLREANVTAFDQVLAVVLETTGDISVLHGTPTLDDRLLRGVEQLSGGVGGDHGDDARS